MPSGRHHPHASSNFARFFPQGDAETTTNSSPVRNSLTGGNTPGSHKVTDEDLLGTLELDKEQKLSAAFVEVQNYDEVSPPSPSLPPIPASVSQTTAISSSPAAMFLSAFMSPKSEPAPLPDDEGQIIAGYTLGTIVGFGSFSTIRKAASTTGSVVAVKIIRRADLVRTGHAPEERKKLEREASIWSSLSHEHILPLFSVVHTSYADYFITTYCPAGSLYDILKRDGHPALPQDDAGMMFRQVVRGLRYLHEVALLVHRDMKLENVLVDESGVCRIGDFGLSIKIGEDEEAIWSEQHEHFHDGSYGNLHRTMSLTNPPSKRPPRVISSLNMAIARHNSTRHPRHSSSQASYVYQPGSLPYAAPELLLPHTSEINPAHPSQDIWALGVMLYALLTGHLPFNDSFEPRLQMKILNGTFDIPKDIGRGAERILGGCMERGVAKRWTISMVDEVAWGVGWGSAGDGATPEESQEDLTYQSPPFTVRSRLDPLDINVPDPNEDDWRHEEHFPRSAIEAASRRSSSRVQRSRSRAPIPTRTSNNRSASQHSRHCSPPPRSGRSSSQYYSGHPSRNPSPGVSPFYEDGPTRSRSRSTHRGRKQTKRCYFEASRSPSPSIVPSTPTDLSHQLLSKLNLRDPSEDLRLDSPPRGRARFCVNNETFDEGEEAVAEEKDALSSADTDDSSRRSLSDWMSPLSSDGSGVVSREGSVDRRSRKQLSWQMDEGHIRKTRPGSTPPTTSKSWELYRTKAANQGLLSRNPSQDMFSPPFPLAANTSNVNVISRSRSVDYPDPSRSVQTEVSPVL